MNWVWIFIDIDPFVIGFLNEVARWTVANAVTILALNTIIGWLQNQAIKLEAIKDNRRLSLVGYYTVILTKCLLYILSFKWMTQFREPKPKKEAPVKKDSP